MRLSCFSLLLATVLLVGLANCVAAQTETATRPNIVVINLDDADTEILNEANIAAHYPAFQKLASRSIRFTNAHSTTPFCAPSRAAFFTGKYAFNNGCKIGREGTPQENGFQGGYQRFKSLGHDQNELGVWMRRSGYRTIHIGKYHHAGFDYLVPEGWDDFSTSLGAKYFNTSKFSNFTAPGIQGPTGIASTGHPTKQNAYHHDAPKRFPIGHDHYITDFERDETLIALQRQFQQRPNQPFFLYLAPLAPHTPLGKDVSKMVHPKYAHYAADQQLPTTDPDFDEGDVSDKSEMIQRPPLTDLEKGYANRLYRSRLRAMKSVDEMLEAVVRCIDDAGARQNTWVIVTSDNGYALGHHRLMAKKTPYQRTSNVPLLVAGPNGQQLTTPTCASHLIAHIDICPTVLELAGVDRPNDLDGKSFAPLLVAPHRDPPNQWRRSILIENWNNKFIGGRHVTMAYTAERFHDSIHIGWANGQHEFYDLQSDPYQLENRFNKLATDRQAALIHSLISFRKPRLPNATITSPRPNQRVSDVIRYTGYVEDNRVASEARLTIKSATTDRFFNGNSWQKSPIDLKIRTDSDNTSISQWSHSVRVFPDNETGSDILVSSVTPIDDEGNSGTPVLVTHSIGRDTVFATFSPSTNGSVFKSDSVELTGFTPSVPNIQVDLTVMDVDTGKYFNGESLQTKHCTLQPENSLGPNWSVSLELPSGRYRGSSLARCGDKQQRQPATVYFEVNKHALSSRRN